MPNPNLVYARPSDIITRRATWVVAAGTQSTNPSYQVAAVSDGKMTRPLKFIDLPVVDVRLTADFGSATRVDGFALPNSNLPGSQTFHVQMNDANTWGSPAVDMIGVVGPAGLDGHRASPWLDLRQADGYSVPGYRYLSVLIPAAAVQPWLGEFLVLARLRTFEVWPQFNGGVGSILPYLEHLQSEYKTQRVTRRKIRQRHFAYQFMGSDQDLADLLALREDAGGLALPWFAAPDSFDAAGGIMIDGGLYGRFTADIATKVSAMEQWFNLKNFPVTFEEDSRGLPF